MVSHHHGFDPGGREDAKLRPERNLPHHHHSLPIVWAFLLIFYHDDAGEDDVGADGAGNDDSAVDVDDADDDDNLGPPYALKCD